MKNTEELDGSELEAENFSLSSPTFLLSSFSLMFTFFFDSHVVHCLIEG
jgi:hypothetical protein